jgi:epoxyqueuosine reductase
MDKAWAKKSGLGWMGKNTNIISPKSGSFFFLAEFISDLELTPDGPIKDYCGTCTRCIDACPTNAIVEPYLVDGSKCISYFTIELKNEIPQSMKGSFDNWIFGCDICQDVCPWNRFSTPHQMNEFEINPTIQKMNNEEWEAIEEESFKVIFKNSPIKRTKLKGLKRNITFIRTK